MPLWEHHMVPIQWGAVIGASLAGAISDVRVQRIPNRLTFPVLVTGMVWATWTGGVTGLLESISGCVLLGLPFVLLFVFAGGGAGDAKLMMALGAWLGVVNGVITLAAVVAAGALWALGLALAKKRLWITLSRLKLMISGLMLAHSFPVRSGEPGSDLSKEEEVLVLPYGLPILTGVCIAGVGIFLLRI